ncbi:Crp/Fnr family transcriptional regulator [Leptolyngbya sp. NK1-12]|uniref:Crp/Fnr family transcriptional regulator n=1 Tax=Leptolyngbya sp. NK1-12 TaxID=2547451 RepID=A0AA96WHT8_9CYAN|nr:Crp/Fnr family transcriptional regulator [Leptolyngbya sp. NK1-12]WNZ25369.1 Crp/Fnr family transcriptional regulator [Leptolyngbya sp. NK1-12]
MLNTATLEANSKPELRQILEELYRGRALQPYKSGQPIRLLPDEVLIVCRGVVQLGTLYDSGDEALLGLACPSMPFGLPLSLIRPYQAAALTDVDLMRLTMAEIEQSPMLAQSIFRHLTRRLQQTEAVLAMVGYRRVEDRLRHLLLLLKQEIGQPATANGTRLGIRLTHQQLANAIGTTRVTVTRLLSQLQEEGWLTVDSTRHIVLPHQMGRTNGAISSGH